MKKKMRFMSLMLVIVMIFSTVSAFADETTASEEVKEKRQEKLFEKFTWFEDAKTNHQAEHVAIHEELDPLKESIKEIRDTNKVEMKAYIEELKAEYILKVEAGELTKEEAKAEIRSIVESKYDKEQHDLYKSQLESLRGDLELNKEERLAIKEEIKLAVNESDDEIVEKLLYELVEIWENHIDIDEEILDIYQEIYENY